MDENTNVKEIKMAVQKLSMQPLGPGLFAEQQF